MTVGAIFSFSNGVVKNVKRSSLKFMLLNPEKHFTEILQQARAVILAGGTMQPVCTPIMCILRS